MATTSFDLKSNGPAALAGLIVSTAGKTQMINKKDKHFFNSVQGGRVMFLALFRVEFVMRVLSIMNEWGLED